jgi:hypothetical protein
VWRGTPRGRRAAPPPRGREVRSDGGERLLFLLNDKSIP